MKATIENTDCIVMVTVDGQTVKARIWKGVREKGVSFELAVMRIAVGKDQDCSQFEKELQEMAIPRFKSEAFDPRMVF
jgi:hypothetical protein